MILTRARKPDNSLSHSNPNHPKQIKIPPNLYPAINSHFPCHLCTHATLKKKHLSPDSENCDKMHNCMNPIKIIHSFLASAINSGNVCTKSSLIKAYLDRINSLLIKMHKSHSTT
jgi:hypothetical protein